MSIMSTACGFSPKIYVGKHYLWPRCKGNLIWTKMTSPGERFWKVMESNNGSRTAPLNGTHLSSTDSNHVCSPTFLVTYALLMVVPITHFHTQCRFFPSYGRLMKKGPVCSRKVKLNLFYFILSLQELLPHSSIKHTVTANRSFCQQSVFSRWDQIKLYRHLLIQRKGFPNGC